ncbi:MAG: redoxin family protein [Pirellulaceae bacterium]|nr:redoxin family protein [Pirellulaceae bacterium]
MDASKCRFLLGSALILTLFVTIRSINAAEPSAEAALRLRPIQADVDFDTPSADEMKLCTVRANSEPGRAGWYVYTAGGQLLRRFLDTNRDNRLDQWCYYKGGVEVYRDIDSDFNGKADQYRWLGTAGTRWGLDENEDGVIDGWKMISAEEVTFEAVAALRERDRARFGRLLPTTADLEALGLGQTLRESLAKKVTSAASGFDAKAQQQTAINATSRWMHFGASPPGILPAGTDGSTRDVMVYDNVSAIVETGGKHVQVFIGTLIRTDGGWRVIDLPSSLGDSSSVDAASGFFFQQTAPQQVPAVAAAGGLSEAMQRLVRELEEVDKAIERTTTPADLSKLNERRATVLQGLADQATTDEERETWIRQYADTVSAATQGGGFPQGVERLRSLAQQLEQRSASAELTGYVKYRYLSADYGDSLQQPNADYAKIQEKWLADLLQFVKDFPAGEDTAEAMLQLAVGEEFAGRSREAVDWYGRIVSSFAESSQAKKAAGAKRRLESVGNPIPLAGNTLDGKQASLAAYRGKTVLIHYWATWCEPCKQDLEILKQIQAKYAAQGLALIGVNLDSDRALAVQFLRSQPLPWPQLYEPGGLDSRFATEMGILTLPTMILVDNEGKVINRSIHAGELDEELSKRLR